MLPESSSLTVGTLLYSGRGKRMLYRPWEWPCLHVSYVIVLIAGFRPQNSMIGFAQA